MRIRIPFFIHKFRSRKRYVFCSISVQIIVPDLQRKASTALQPWVFRQIWSSKVGSLESGILNAIPDTKLTCIKCESGANLIRSFNWSGSAKKKKKKNTGPTCFIIIEKKRRLFSAALRNYSPHLVFLFMVTRKRLRCVQITAVQRATLSISRSDIYRAS
jgi:hypothetical protein